MAPEAASAAAAARSAAQPSKTRAPATAPRIGPHMRRHSMGGPACRTTRSFSSGIASPAGSTPTSTGSAASMRFRPSALTFAMRASWRPSQAMSSPARARPAASFPRGGRQSTCATAMPRAARSAAKLRRPTLTTRGAPERRPDRVENFTAIGGGYYRSMSFRIRRVGGTALSALRGGSATVFASFERSCYVETPAGIACLGSHGLGLGPLNGIVENFEAPATGDVVSIDLSSALLWQPSVSAVMKEFPGIEIPKGIEYEARAFLSWLKNEGTPLDALIGLGPGLTPAGDDFAGGAMIALGAA